MKKISLISSAALLLVGLVCPQAYARVNETPAHDAFIKCENLEFAPSRTNAPRANEGEEEPYLFYTYADEVATAYSLNNQKQGNVIWLAAEYPASLMANYKNNKITAVEFVTATNESSIVNTIRDVEIFIIEDQPENVPVYLQSARVPAARLKECEIKLNTPYEVTGDKTLYIGWRFALPANFSSQYYVPVDGIVNKPRTLMYSVTDATVGVNASSNAEVWNVGGDEIGALCLGFKVQGDNLPKNLGRATEIDVRPYYPKGERISYDVDIENFGINPITSIEVRTYCSDGTDYTKTITLNEPIGVNDSGTVNVNNVPNNAEGYLTLNSTVTKINGVAIPDPASFSALTTVYSDGFTKNLVMEEATGAWCQWCPSGIVMMEYLKEKYNDRWFRIAVHNDDRMAISAYQAFIRNFAPGFPYAVVDRSMGVYPTDAEVNNTLDEYYNDVTSYPAMAGLQLSAEPSEDNSVVNVSASAQFSFDTNVPFGLSFVVVEDGVGPYNQQNKYSGGAYGPMGGFEDLPNPCSIKFDDVARSITGYPVIPNSLPSNVKKGESYDYSTPISIATVRGGSFRVIGLLINTQTNQIVNAAQVTTYKSGVDDILADKSIDIKVVNGSIIADGAQSVAVYSLDGRRVSAEKLPAGVYIVNADGKSSKILVK